MIRFNPKAIMPLAILLAVAAVIFYWRVGIEENPGDYHVRKGNYRLEDGQFEEALKEFHAALTKNPDNVYGHLGLGITYMQTGDDAKALAEFDKTIDLAPDLAVAYADKGILLDRQGRYQDALDNYEKAISLDAETVEGPGFLYRFMRNMAEKPPGIRDRALYLQQELAKPAEQRLLKVPEIDKKQGMYKAN
jgi:tetratricopeptide (TPR) repeat protein